MSKIHPDVLARYDNHISRFEPRIENDFEINPPDTLVPGTSLKHIRWMLREIPTLQDEEKAHRWLGFIQGVLIVSGFTTTQKERDFTRPYFTK